MKYSYASGKLLLETDAISMLGGHAINVSGPCFKENDIIKLQLEEVIVDCQRVSVLISVKCVEFKNTVFAYLDVYN